MKLFIIVATVLTLGSPSLAQTSYTEYQHPLGVSFSLPDDWDNPDIQTLLKLAKTETSLRKEAPAEVIEALDAQTRIFLILKAGLPSGATLSLSIDPIPPLDRLTQDDLHNFTDADWFEMENIMETVGINMVESLELYGGFLQAEYQSYRLVDIGNLICFSHSFESITQDKLEVEQTIYNCPAGPISLRIQSLVAIGKYAEYKADITQVLSSIHTR